MTIQVLPQSVMTPGIAPAPDASREPVGRAVVWTGTIAALGGVLFGHDNGVVSGAPETEDLTLEEIERQMAGATS
jgi:hypothetical protein